MAKCKNCRCHLYPEDGKMIGFNDTVHRDPEDCIRGLAERLERLEDRTREVPLPDDD